MTILRKFKVITLMFAVVSLSACSSCKKDEGSKQTIEVTIGTFSKAVDYGPLYIARHFGWLEDQNLEISLNFSEFDDRNKFATELEVNRLHLIFAALPPIAITKAQDVEVVIVDVSCTLRQEILVRKELALTILGQI